jgi:hypothetical protein
METALPTRIPFRTAHLITAAKIIAPLILSGIVAWGSVQYSKGRDAQRLDTVERNAQHALTREEFQTWATEQRDRLHEINERLMNREKREK